MVARPARLLAAEVDGETVIMDVDDGVYLALDATGTEIFKLLETPCRVSDLVDRLSERYSGTRAEIQADVLVFLKDLQLQNIVTVQ